MPFSEKKHHRLIIKLSHNHQFKHHHKHYCLFNHEYLYYIHHQIPNNNPTYNDTNYINLHLQKPIITGFIYYIFSKIITFTSLCKIHHPQFHQYHQNTTPHHIKNTKKNLRNTHLSSQSMLEDHTIHHTTNINLFIPHLTYLSHISNNILYLTYTSENITFYITYIHQKLLHCIF